MCPINGTYIVFYYYAKKNILLMIFYKQYDMGQLSIICSIFFINNVNCQGVTFENFYATLFSV